MNANQGNKQSDQQQGQHKQGGSQGGKQQPGALPRSPGTGPLAADDDMDEDTGLSNRANRQSSEIERDNQQLEQSNVGRRDDGTPD